MIYKTYRATNPVRWRDGNWWQVGWRLYLVGWHTAGAVNRWWVRSPNDRLALVSVWGSPEPIFVSEDELEEMPMREEEISTSLDAKPGTWESSDPLASARAEANDLMQRLTESQQELTRVSKVNQEHAEMHLALYKTSLDTEQELAEVKAERDRLAGQVIALEAEQNRTKEVFHRNNTRCVKLDSIIGQVRRLLSHAEE